MLELEELVVCKVMLVIVCHGGEIKTGCIQGMELDIFVSAQTRDLAKCLNIVFFWKMTERTGDTQHEVLPQDMIYTGHLKIDNLKS